MRKDEEKLDMDSEPRIWDAEEIGMRFDSFNTQGLPDQFVDYSALESAVTMRDEYCSRLQEKCDDVLALIEEKKALEKERDELRAKVIRWHADHDAYFIERAKEQDLIIQKELTQTRVTLAEVDHLIPKALMVDGLIRERDEARERAAHLKDHATLIQEIADKKLSGARAEIEQLKNQIARDALEKK